MKGFRTPEPPRTSQGTYNLHSLEHWRVDWWLQTILDRFMPVYHFSEVHAITVRAPPARVFNAIKIVTPAETPVFRLLFGIRSLPRRLAGRGATRFGSSESVLRWATGVGFVLLGEETDRELVLGWVGQFWKLVGGSSPMMSDSEEFVGFNRPGYAKAAFNFYLHDLPDQAGLKLSTETRVYATDPVARRKFAAYWRLIHGGSALVRREWLTVIRRRSEAQ